MAEDWDWDGIDEVAIANLNSQFVTSAFSKYPPIPCIRGDINADAVSPQAFLFSGGAPPPAPSVIAGCGTDPTPDILDRGSFPPSS